MKIVTGIGLDNARPESNAKQGADISELTRIQRLCLVLFKVFDHVGINKVARLYRWHVGKPVGGGLPLVTFALLEVVSLLWFGISCLAGNMILASVFAIVLCFTIASHMGARVFKYGEPSLYSAYLKACKKAIPTTSLNAYKVEKEMRERLNKLTWLESGINPNMHIPNLVDVHNFEPWLQRISLGRYHAHLSPCKEYQDKTDRMRLDGSNVEEIALKMQREYNEAMDVLEDVLDIWRSALQSRGVGWLVFREGGAEMEVREVAETFAVDIMLDSYFSGVPAADIAA